MREFIDQYYLWIRAFHLISVMAWMAGMLYLPRLFVYHTGAAKGSQMSETFKLMERRLIRIIMNPAMIFAWIFGGLMLYANPLLFEAPWMHLKLTCVLIMTALHHVFVFHWKKFERDRNDQSAKYYRIMNEVPTALMIVIVIMAIVNPDLKPG